MNESVIYNFNQTDYEEAIRLHEEDIAEFGSIEGNAQYYYCLAKSYQEINDTIQAERFYNLILDEYDDYGEYNSLAKFGLISLDYELGLDNQIITSFNSIYFPYLIEIEGFHEDTNIVKAIDNCIDIIKSILEKKSLDDKTKEELLLIKKTKNNNIILQIAGCLLSYCHVTAEELLDNLLAGIENFEPEVIKTENILKLFLKYFHNELMYCNDERVSEFIKKNENKIVFLISKTSFCLYDKEWSYLVELIERAFENEFYNLVLQIYENFDYGLEDESFPDEAILNFAYSANILNNNELAKTLYEYYLKKDNTPPGSVFNNLGNIYHEEKDIEKAIELFKKAVDIDHDDPLYFFNLASALIDNAEYIDAFKMIREGQKLSPKDSRIKPLIDKLPNMYNNRYPNPNLVKEQQDKLNEYYWNMDITTTEIKKRFKLPSNAREYFAYLIYPDQSCPNCNSNLVYKSRNARSENKIFCEKCEHEHFSDERLTNISYYYSCDCEYCKNVRKQNSKRKLAEEQKKKQQEFNENVEKASTPEFIKSAISQLSFSEKIFTKAMYELIEGGKNATLNDVCKKVNVSSSDLYVKKLLSLSLMFINPNNEYTINSNVNSSLIKITYPLNISNKTRFDILKRDRHTCRYCGRKPPEVELDIDYDVPVVEGGTDSFDNLLCLCRECKIGKIESDENNDLSQEWQQVLKKKEEIFESVKQYWLACMGGEFSEYDEELARNFLEKYEPTWIKKAIKITSEKNISKYGNYISAILKNWDEKGFPEDAVNIKLSQKMATENQISYIEGLLSKNNLTLKQCCGKEDINKLTMLDAKNIIEELAGKV